jgi:hypothetical protein
MLSAITDVSLGDGLLMSSRAKRTAAMMDAAITRVEANLSVKRCCSSIDLDRSRSSQTMARFIKPISATIQEAGMVSTGAGMYRLSSRRWQGYAVSYT